MTYRPPLYDAQREGLEARFARRVVGTLDEFGVGHDIAQRLRVAREQAVSQARHARVAVAASSLMQTGDGSAVLAGPPWWLRLASLAPLVVLAAGLLLIDQLNGQEEIFAAAEIDAVLLADELPPTAYGDPGFGEFLKQPLP